MILATLTVIAAVLPMAFVQGLMGPYMRPIPIGATAAMLFSMAVSFVVTPWAANRMLRRIAARSTATREREDWTTRAYRRVMGPLIQHRWRGIAFLCGITLLLAGAVGLILVGAVKVKMLPFDNKSELQVIIDMDEGTTLEKTLRVARAIAAGVRREPEVTNYQIYTGIAAPYNFNGLIRHYFLRKGPNVADIQVNFVRKEERSLQSHDIAKRLREKIRPIAERYGARVKIAEVPPGPPVLQTLVAEVYGPDYAQQIENARRIRGVFEHTAGVVDVDWYMEADQPELTFHLDQEKAALHRISAEQVAEIVRIAEAGADVGLLHASDEKEDVLIRARLPIGQRARDLRTSLPLPVIGAGGSHRSPRRAGPAGAAHRGEEHLPQEPAAGGLRHGRRGGAEESPVYAILKLNKELHKLKLEGLPPGTPLEIWSTRQPFSTLRPR